MDLLIATKNGHKIREFRSLLKRLKGFDLYSLIDFPEYIPPFESGKTFEENAILKAADAAKRLNKWALADDSGLIVPALQGKPGVFSARYAGEEATDKENRKKLLAEMNGLNAELRSAFFECCLALTSPDGKIKVARGLCEGRIIEAERGGNGFGYDPLFIKHDYNQTFGEISESVKNQISHRAKALEKITPMLESLL